jgi:hypothetical protein
VRGATKPEHYAIPQCFKYPIQFTTHQDTEKHVLNATSRLVQNHKRYPKSIRDQAARNIDKARVKLGRDPYRWPWKKKAAQPGQVIRLLPKGQQAAARRKMAAN